MVIQIFDGQQKKQIAGDILYQLPDWFGLPESTKRYIEESAEMPFWTWIDDTKENMAGQAMAEKQATARQALGFLALKETSPYTAEVFVMGVLPEFHHQGIGRKLYFAFEDYAKEKGYAFIQVKTVQSGHYKEYDCTNAFYQAMGFLELECFPTLWDKWNPCQIYIKSINRYERMQNENRTGNV